jgi:hypothetical protein
MDTAAVVATRTAATGAARGRQLANENEKARGQPLAFFHSNAVELPHAEDPT